MDQLIIHCGNSIQIGYFTTSDTTKPVRTGRRFDAECFFCIGKHCCVWAFFDGSENNGCPAGSNMELRYLLELPESRVVLNRIILYISTIVVPDYLLEKNRDNNGLI